MIGILAAVVVVVGVVAVTDLLLSFAVVRRLAAIELRGGLPGAGNALSPAIGHRVGEFRMNLLTGAQFTRADLAGTSATVVFVMPSCEPCKEVLADLRELPIPLSPPLYVLATGAEQDSDIIALMDDLPSGALLGAVLPSDDVTRAFGVTGFPTALTIEDGIVRSAGLRVRPQDLVSK